MTKQAAALDDYIGRMKEWAEANYENGADTFVECWSTEDYQRCLDNHDGDFGAAMHTLERCADIYLERQADARNSRF